MRHRVLPCFVLATAVSAGTLDDMTIRSNVESSIRGTAQTAMLHLKIDVQGGVVTPAGVVSDLNQADEVVDLASRIRAVIRVDRSELRLEFDGPPDEQIAAMIDRDVRRVPKFAASSVRVAVEGGVATLTGAIKNAAWRRELRHLCGSIEGVADVVDRLDTPETPDDTIQRVLDSIFGARAVPPFPGRVHASVKEGAVTLEGRVPRLYDRNTAERQAGGINGVRRVDDGLVLGSGTKIEVIRP